MCRVVLGILSSFTFGGSFPREGPASGTVVDLVRVVVPIGGLFLGCLIQRLLTRLLLSRGGFCRRFRSCCCLAGVRLGML